jgi:hypothetical protein
LGLLGLPSYFQRRTPTMDCQICSEPFALRMLTEDEVITQNGHTIRYLAGYRVIDPETITNHMAAHCA